MGPITCGKWAVVFVRDVNTTFYELEFPRLDVVVPNVIFRLWIPHK